MTAKETNTQTEGLTNKQTKKQTIKQTKTQKNKKTNKQKNNSHLFHSDDPISFREDAWLVSTVCHHH